MQVDDTAQFKTLLEPRGRVGRHKGDYCVSTYEAAKYDAIDFRISLSATMESSKPGVSIRVTGTPST